MPTLLIVDDEPHARDALSLLLGGVKGFVVKVAASSDEAIEVAEAHPPNLLITDWVLKESTDGMLLADLLRQSLPSLPVILLTGLPSTRLQSRVKSTPRTWMLTKPCRFEEFRRTIDTALNANDAQQGARNAK